MPLIGGGYPLLLTPTQNPVASLLKIFMGLTLVHFQKYWLLSTIAKKVHLSSSMYFNVGDLYYILPFQNQACKKEVCTILKWWVGQSKSMILYSDFWLVGLKMLKGMCYSHLDDGVMLIYIPTYLSGETAKKGTIFFSYHFSNKQWNPSSWYLSQLSSYYWL